jgi:ParB family chromosome partitioning protein
LPSTLKKLGLGGINRLPNPIMAIDPENVKAIAASMKVSGLINPLTVRVREGRGNGYWLIAGAHRLAAAKRLKWASIECIVLDDIEASAAELLTVDENLVRRTLTAAQRALLTRRRKELYEAMHPETKQGGAKGNAGKGRGKAPSIKGPKTGSFIADTATRTGKSRSSIKADATRGKRLGDDLARVAGTSLDKGAELDALAKMSKPEREALIRRAEAGEQVSALQTTAPPEKGVGYGELVDTLDDLVEAEEKHDAAKRHYEAAWRNASEQARATFREDYPEAPTIRADLRVVS